MAAGGGALDRELVCPITQELMDDPVVCADGHTYERDALARWFATGKTRSPVSNALLESQMVFPNLCVRRLVQAHRRELGEALLELSDAGMPALQSRVAVLDLLDRGADLDVRDSAGNSPLMNFLRRGEVGLCELLLDRGASVNLANEAGETALTLAERDWPSTMAARLASCSQAEQRASEEKELARLREQELYRQTQARVQEGESQEAERRARRVVIVRNTVGFFPSLFGLQFLNIDSTVRGGNSSLRPINAAGRLLFGQRFLVPDEDVEQYRLLSNVTLAAWVTLLLATLLFF